MSLVGQRWLVVAGSVEVVFLLCPCSHLFPFPFQAGIPLKES